MCCSVATFDAPGKRGKQVAEDGGRVLFFWRSTPSPKKTNIDQWDDKVLFTCSHKHEHIRDTVPISADQVSGHAPPTEEATTTSAGSSATTMIEHCDSFHCEDTESMTHG